MTLQDAPSREKIQNDKMKTDIEYNSSGIVYGVSQVSLFFVGAKIGHQLVG